MAGAKRVELLTGHQAAGVQAALGVLLDDIVNLLTKTAEGACRAIGHLRHVRDKT